MYINICNNTPIQLTSHGQFNIGRRKRRHIVQSVLAHFQLSLPIHCVPPTHFLLPPRSVQFSYHSIIYLIYFFPLPRTGPDELNAVEARHQQQENNLFSSPSQLKIKIRSSLINLVDERKTRHVPVWRVSLLHPFQFVRIARI